MVSGVTNRLGVCDRTCYAEYAAYLVTLDGLNNAINGSGDLLVDLLINNASKEESGYFSRSSLQTVEDELKSEIEFLTKIITWL